MPSFQHLLVADLSGGVDLELLRYSANVGRAITEGTAVLTAAGARCLRSFAPAVRQIYEEEQAVEPAIGVLPEPDLQTLLSVARASESDLILAGYCAASRQQREMARRLLCEAPCSVWLLPTGFTGSLTRLATAFDPDPQGAALLSLSAKLSRALGAECLTAVNVWFTATVLDPADPPPDDDIDRRLALYRFLRDVDLEGVPCDLRTEHSPSPSQRLVEIALVTGADLLVVTAPQVSGLGYLLRRDGTGEYLSSGLPFLVVRTSDGNGNIWRDLFALSEPAFS